MIFLYSVIISSSPSQPSDNIFHGRSYCDCSLKLVKGPGVTCCVSSLGLEYRNHVCPLPFTECLAAVQSFAGEAELETLKKQH